MSEEQKSKNRIAKLEASLQDALTALGHYTNAEVVTSWGYQETADDGKVARDAIKRLRRTLGQKRPPIA